MRKKSEMKNNLCLFSKGTCKISLSCTTLNWTVNLFTYNIWIIIIIIIIIIMIIIKLYPSSYYKFVREKNIACLIRHHSFCVPWALNVYEIIFKLCFIQTSGYLSFDTLHAYVLKIDVALIYMTIFEFKYHISLKLCVLN